MTCQIQTGKRLLRCSAAWHIYVFCSGDCDSGDEENEETIDATEIHENLMDTTTSMFALF